LIRSLFDLVLVNRHLPDLECEELLRELSKRGVAVACVVMLPGPPDMTDFTSLEALGARSRRLSARLPPGG
jgi:hypothetical protein